jgi:hypothetical protein
LTKGIIHQELQEIGLYLPAFSAMAGDLVYSFLVAATFESGFHEYINHLFRITVLTTGGDAYHIGIIVFARQFRQFFTPADSCSYALVFIGAYGYPICAAAQ